MGVWEHGILTVPQARGVQHPPVSAVGTHRGQGPCLSPHSLVSTGCWWIGEGSSGTKMCPAGLLFSCGAGPVSLDFDPGNDYCRNHTPQHQDSMLGGHGEEGQDEGS